MSFLQQRLANAKPSNHLEFLKYNKFREIYMEQFLKAQKEQTEELAKKPEEEDKEAKEGDNE